MCVSKYGDKEAGVYQQASVFMHMCVCLLLFFVFFIKQLGPRLVVARSSTIQLHMAAASQAEASGRAAKRQSSRDMGHSQPGAGYVMESLLSGHHCRARD